MDLLKIPDFIFGILQDNPQKRPGRYNMKQTNKTRVLQKSLSRVPQLFESQVGGGGGGIEVFQHSTENLCHQNWVCPEASSIVSSVFFSISGSCSDQLLCTQHFPVSFICRPLEIVAEMKLDII